MEWREATRDEIYRYYRGPFSEKISSLPEFITPNGPKQWALAFDESFPVIDDDAPDRDFIRRDTRNPRTEKPLPEFQTFDDVLSFIQQPAEADPLRNHGSDKALADPALVSKPSPVAEAVYFAVDSWERSWPVYMDIDAKDIAFEIAKNRIPDDSGAETREEIRKQGAILGEPPQGYPYRFKDIKRALEYAFELEAIFQDELHADDTLVVYSGQGAHVYLLDDTGEHRYDEASREVLNTIVEELCDIPIDPVVTADRRRVARLPYSLHAEVSRVVQPISSPSFDFKTDAAPPYLQDTASHP